MHIRYYAKNWLNLNTNNHSKSTSTNYCLESILDAVMEIFCVFLKKDNKFYTNPILQHLEVNFTNIIAYEIAFHCI